MLHVLALILAVTTSGPTPSPVRAIQYTTADVTLYVNPLGSDSNACTSTGVAACLTIQGAFNKSPKVLRHRLTVNVAAGNYAGVTISGFTIDPAFQKSTAGILLDGALANVTPATGTATGTATAGSAGSTTTFGTLTDSSQSWTVNDPALVGKYVVITGGTGSGQVRVIQSNTATVLTVTGLWTAPTTSSTYAIQSSSANITSAAAAIPGGLATTTVAAAGIQIVNNNAGTAATGVAFINVRNMNISIAATAGVIVAASNAVNFLQVSTSSTTNFGFNILGNHSAYFSTCSLTNTSGPGIAASASIISISNTRFDSTASNNVLLVGQTNATVTQCQLTGTRGVQIQGGSSASFSLSRCDCLSASNSVCLLSGTLPALLASSGPSNSNTASVIGMDVTNCTTGILASGQSQITVTGVLSGNALGYAVNSVHGSSVILPTATATITGATAEMSVDSGAQTAAFGSLGASFACLSSSTGTTSRICRL